MQPLTDELRDFEQFLRYQRFLADLTIKEYIEDLVIFKSFLEQDLLKTPLLDITKEHISAFLAHLKTKCSNATVRAYVISLRAFYIWAAYIYKKDNLFEVNYFLKNIVKIKPEKKIPFIPSIVEITQLRNTLKSYKELQSYNTGSFTYRKILFAYAVFELCITSGLRSKELRGLCRKDIDLENKSMFIRQGKGGAQRFSLFGESAWGALQEWLAINNFKEEDLVFPIKHNTTLPILIKRWAKLSRINPKIHIHSFRHYFITESQRQGVPIQTVAQQVGHTDLNSTRAYTHLDINFVKEKYTQINI